MSIPKYIQKCSVSVSKIKVTKIHKKIKQQLIYRKSLHLSTSNGQKTKYKLSSRMLKDSNTIILSCCL